MKLTRKHYETTQEKRNDFFLGVFVFVLLNGVLLALIIAASGFFSAPTVDNTTGQNLAMGLNLLAWVLNIGLIIFFALTRSWVALGMLGAIGGLLALAVIFAVLAGVACLIIFSLSGISP